MSKKKNAYDVIRAPAITEKSTLVSEHNQVVFKVANDATKADIKAAVENLFNVKVKAVNTQVRKGKMKAFRDIRLPPERHQEGDRDPRRGPHHRRNDGALGSSAMALKTCRPTTPGLRQLVLVDRSHLWKGAPVKMLTDGKSKTGGRNNHGRMTTRHIGGGHKQAYRRVDFRRRKFDLEATVERLEYDPNRTAFLALLKYQDGTQSYILAPQRLAAGDSVVSGVKADVKPGNAMQLASMPIGTIVHNVEFKSGATAARWRDRQGPTRSSWGATQAGPS